MKKIISMLLISAMLVTALAACNNNNDSGSTDNNSSSAPESSSPESGTPESTTPDESTTPEESSDPESYEPWIDDWTDEWTEAPGVDNSGLPFPDNKAGSLVKAALATGNWPAMDLLTEQDTVDFMISSDLKLENCEEYCLATNIISSQLYKVVIVKPAAGSEDDIKTILDNYLEAVKTDPNIAFYPGQQASADGAVSGKTDDGYLYVIVHDMGADVESGMLAAQ